MKLLSKVGSSLWSLARGIGLLVAIVAGLLIGGEPWTIDQDGRTVYPKGSEPIGRVGHFSEGCIAWILCGFVLAYWALFGWWLEKLEIGHVPQYKGADGRTIYAKKPK